MDNETSFKTGALVIMRPVDAPHVQFRMRVTHCNPGIAVQLWNGRSEPWRSQPFLTLQPDGTWANGSGIRYTLSEGGL